MLAACEEPPKALLSECGQLLPYGNHDLSGSCDFGWASTTKSFLVTHYKGIRSPLSENNVLYPFGLKLFYYDRKRRLWGRTMSFPVRSGHLSGLDESLVTLLNLKADPGFPADANRVSSYEIAYSKFHRPLELTIHEFMAYQSILSSKECGWMSLLREHGASNLNISLEETMYIYTYLCHQVGLMIKQNRGRNLRPM